MVEFPVVKFFQTFIYDLETGIKWTWLSVKLRVFPRSVALGRIYF